MAEQLALTECIERPGTPKWKAWQETWLDREIERRRDDGTFGLTQEEHQRWERGETKDIYTSRLPNVGVIPSCDPAAFSVAKYTAGPKGLPWVIIWHSARYGPVVVMWERRPPFPHPMGAPIPWVTDMELAGYQTRRQGEDALARMVQMMTEHPAGLHPDANGGDLIP